MTLCALLAAARIERMGVDNPIIHSTKLFGGRETAMEIHRRLAWNNHKCDGCNAKDTSIRIQTFVLLSDMSLDTQVAIEFQLSIKKLHAIKTPSGRAVRTGVMHACPRCAPALERAAAKGPSYAIVDIDRGPGEDKPLIAVVSSI